METSSAATMSAAASKLAGMRAAENEMIHQVAMDLMQLDVPQAQMPPLPPSALDMSHNVPSFSEHLQAAVQNAASQDGLPDAVSRMTSTGVKRKTADKAKSQVLGRTLNRLAQFVTVFTSAGIVVRCHYLLTFGSHAETDEPEPLWGKGAIPEKAKKGGPNAER